MTAGQTGNTNYPAASPVPWSFSVTTTPLALVAGLTSSLTGAVKTGSTVPETLTLGNHPKAAQIVTVNVAVTYTGSHGSRNLVLPLIVKLKAERALSQAVRFPITALFPRGTYTLSATASDKSGDTAASSATLTVS
ncbi:MAG: hypothetical protein ACRDG4_12510 [Chloroflexota bacterium]